MLSRVKTYATVCSGVECCSLALDAAYPTKSNWEPVFFSEIAPFQSALLEYRFPKVPNLGDICNIRCEKGIVTNGTRNIQLHGRLDLLAGGTPCQDFSIAGKRSGGAKDSGTRSSLCWEWLRLVSELSPRVVLWENVIGTFSSNGGRDFYELVRSLDALGYCVAWRVLDCQYSRVDFWPLAIPQRRRRVWLVGCADASAKDTAEILFEPSCLLGDSAPVRREGSPHPGFSKDRVRGASTIRMRHGCEGGGKGALIGNNISNTLGCQNDQSVIAGSYPTLTASTQQLTNAEIEQGGLISHGSSQEVFNFELRCNGPLITARRSQDNLIYGASCLTPWDNESRRVYPSEGSAPTIPAKSESGQNSQAFLCESQLFENHAQDSRVEGPIETASSITRKAGTGGGNGWAVNSARWVLLGIHRFLNEHCN